MSRALVTAFLSNWSNASPAMALNCGRGSQLQADPPVRTLAERAGCWTVAAP